jgi:hypothetical protein
MILSHLESNITNLLNSDKSVAICEAEGERLKHLILLVRDGGYGVVVVQTVSGDHYVVATANRNHEGNLAGDTRRWNRECGYHFSLKRADERISASDPNIVVLPDGRIVEIRRTYTTASGFTHWGLSSQQTIPAGYVRL